MIMERESKKYRVCQECAKWMEEHNYHFVKRVTRPENNEHCISCRAKMESFVYILSKE